MSRGIYTYLSSHLGTVDVESGTFHTLSLAYATKSELAY